MFRLRSFAAFAIIVAGILEVTSAQSAGVRVGDAIQVIQEVNGRQSGNRDWDRKGKGDDVYENEAIRTAVESRAQILLVDRTGLTMGPTSEIRVDRIVYNPNQSIKGIIMTTDSGTVRWTSGDSGAYLIKTPTARIEPIGTVFDLFVDDQRTFVMLRQGRVRVCTNAAQPVCKVLANPGEMVLATTGELQGPARGGPEPTDFENRCLSATGRNCVMNVTYNRAPAPQQNRRADRGPSRSRFGSAGPVYSTASYTPPYVRRPVYRVPYVRGPIYRRPASVRYGYRPYLRRPYTTAGYGYRPRTVRAGYGYGPRRRY